MACLTKQNPAEPATAGSEGRPSWEPTLSTQLTRDHGSFPNAEKEADREARLREVASKLFFTLKNQGLRFSLYRDVDVPEPIRHDGLSLDEVEDTYSTYGSFVARMVADAPRPGSRYAAEAVSRIQFCALNGWRRCYRVEHGFHTPASLGES